MWETVELREIRIFVALAEELHFGRTGERLGLSQSRVSQAVRSLEAQLGGRLFERTSRRVALTPYGREALTELRGPSEAMSRALATVYRQSAKLEGTLTIAWLTPTAQGPHLPEIIGHFHERHPDCEITINDQPLGTAAIETVVDRKANMLISWLPLNAPALVRGPIISSEERVLGVSRNHPLANRVRVTLEEVADYPVSPSVQGFPEEFIEALVPTTAPSGRPIRRLNDRAVSSPTDALMLWVRGETVHPTIPSVLAHFGHPDGLLIPIDGMPPLRSALFWRADADDPRIDAFVQIARDVLPASLSEGEET
jgi:DNA-binding transcriptional LysR family regulator